MKLVHMLRNQLEILTAASESQASREWSFSREIILTHTCGVLWQVWPRSSGAARVAQPRALCL